jgi:hypothetical protein
MVTVARAGANPRAAAVISYFSGTRLSTINVPLSLPTTLVVAPLARFLMVSLAFAIGEPVGEVILPAMDLPTLCAGTVPGINPSITVVSRIESSDLVTNYTPLPRHRVYSRIDKQNLNPTG